METLIATSKIQPTSNREVRAAINNLKDNKTAGIDNIAPELLLADAGITA